MNSPSFSLTLFPLNFHVYSSEEPAFRWNLSYIIFSSRVHFSRLNIIESRGELKYSDRKGIPCFVSLSSRRNDISVVRRYLRKTTIYAWHFSAWWIKCAAHDATPTNKGVVFTRRCREIPSDKSFHYARR